MSVMRLIWVISIQRSRYLALASCGRSRRTRSLPPRSERASLLMRVLTCTRWVAYSTRPRPASVVRGMPGSFGLSGLTSRRRSEISSPSWSLNHPMPGPQTLEPSSSGLTRSAAHRTSVRWPVQARATRSGSSPRCIARTAAACGPGEAAARAGQEGDPETTSEECHQDYCGVPERRGRHAPDRGGRPGYRTRHRA
jgi:hypothetical protein